MTTRQEVYAAIDTERVYQRKRALESGKPGEAQHSVEEFTLYMGNYLEELRHVLTRNWTPDGKIPGSLDIIRKVTALGVACMEQHGAPVR